MILRGSRLMSVCFLVAAFLLSPEVLSAQSLRDPEPDPCGWPDTTTASYRLLAAANWGYGYDSLLTDIGTWRQSPYAVIDSIGASVQGRTLFRLTITNPLMGPQARPRIWVHARTHPQEVEGTHVTNEMVRILLSEGEPGATLRQRYIFSIVPMYNPDGVELSYPRQNANGIDLESNWNSPAPELEVQTLRAQFQQFMASSEPIKVALNMHSSSRGRRYFVYHSPVGTSELFAELEKKFIGFIRNRTPGRIEPWDYFVSWTVATATQYPESWFWMNHAEAVMALTYEDIYGVVNGGFDTTAQALLLGVDDYLTDVATGVGSLADMPARFELGQNFPNPFNGTSVIRFRTERSGHIVLAVYDLVGREVARLADGHAGAGMHVRTIRSDGLPSGTYVYRLVTPEGTAARVLTVLR